VARAASNMAIVTNLKWWYLVHKWTSLLCTLFLLLLCLSGLPLIFGEEIGYWLDASVTPPEMDGAMMKADLDALAADARARRPKDAIQTFARDEDAPAWFVSMGETADVTESSALFMYDSRTGALLQDLPLREGFLHVMFMLHVELFSGLPGTLFLSGMGLLFVASILSGVVVYGPFMRKLPFGTVRHAGSPRLAWLDLHNLLGIVTVVWALVVGGTGVVNTLARPLFAYWQQTELAEMTAPWQGKPAPAAFSSVDRAVAAAEAMDVQKEAAFVAFPGTPFAGLHHYAIFLRGRTPLTARLLEPVLVDAETGAVAATRAMPWYMTALLLSQPLHFGDYGGLPLKMLWALLNLLTIAVLFSGLHLWWKKRHQAVEQLLAETDRESERARAPGTGAVRW